MKYDIVKPASPKVPTPENGTESIPILLKHVSKNMY